MRVAGKKTVISKLNLDAHNSLLGERDLVYLLNGDITGYENSNNNLFVQNCLSNGLCVNFPQGYTYQNGIYLDNFEYLVFFYKAVGNQSEIGLFNANDCSYQTIVNSPCLNLQKPIRGVYKRLNSSNERVAYWVDGLNPDRYINVDKSLNGDYPKKTTALLSESCATCNSEIIDELDCNKLRFNREFVPTCLSLKSNKQGGFTTGTYQVAIAYGDDNFTFTDYYFSDVLKVLSQNKYDVGFEVTIDCKYSPFSTFRVVLITQTKEGSLIAYDYGFYPTSSTFITLNNSTNASVINVSEVLTKRVLYDYSEHITSNDETLLRGKHRAVEPLEYQSRANEIDVSWVVKKVPYKKAHLYPNFMRDEVYDLSIEWIDELGRDRGNFHIPGRVKDDGWVLNAFGVPLHEYDSPNLFYNIESLEDCPTLPTEIWQVENTAYVTNTYSVDCPDCEENNISQVGKMGYYECQDILYPDEDRWGSLRCTPVRRHRMPPNEICHIHNNGSCVTTTESTTAWSGLLGSLVNTEYNVRDFAPNPCVNILGIRLNNIQIPYIDGEPMLNWSYRVCYSDRQGNKSVLHKGLIFNVWKEIDEGTEIMYPNYPYNDLNPDKYLSKTQTEEYPSGSPDYTNVDDYFRTRFTYHSPDIHFKETQNEFGSELRFYTEEIGKVKGEFKESYRHPKVAIGADVPDVKTSWPYAQQFNSAAHYESFQPFPYHLEKRRKIDFSQYLLPIKQLVNGKRFNNDMRETSYFIELSNDRTVPNPINEDVSRLSRSELVDCRNKIDFCETYGVDEKPIQGVSYYVGVKVKQPNQYGQLSTIKYKPVESCYRKVTDLILNEQDFFGGDIYISRHSVLRKMPLFREWLYDVPYNTETDYRDKRNIWYPIFWYDNLTVSADLYRLSCYQADTLEENGDEGYIYTWVTGNVYFWCESEFIGDFREIDSTPNSRFYPKVDFNEIAKSDNISLQPTFLYDFSLNNYTIETKYLSNYTKSDAQFTVSYSLKNDLQSSGDNWLKFLPLNYSVLPQVYGEFTGLHYVDQYSIFFIFENMILYSQEDYTLQTLQGNSVFLGQGDIFSRRLGKLSNDKTGYTGSVDPLSFINTRFGTFFFDRLRKRFFQWTGQLKELEGITSWLQIHSDYDTRTQGYDTSMITVWDNYTEKIYFTDRINNWTISYDPKYDGFISFHSFIPSWYLHLPNNFISVKNGTNGFWKHNQLGSYQRYYGIPYPFDIGFIENPVQDVDFQSISIDAEFYKYNGYLDKTYVKDRFFDRALIYNHQGSTGILQLYLKNKNNPKDSLVQSKDQHNIAEVTHVKGNTYNINQLENNHLGQNLPMIILESDGVTYHPVNTGVKLPTEREEIKGSWLRCHLISDNKESEKIIVHLSNLEVTPIQR